MMSDTADRVKKIVVEHLGVDEMAALGDRYDPGLKLELYRAAAER